MFRSFGSVDFSALFRWIRHFSVLFCWIRGFVQLWLLDSTCFAVCFVGSMFFRFCFVGYVKSTALFCRICVFRRLFCWIRDFRSLFCWILEFCTLISFGEKLIINKKGRKNNKNVSRWRPRVGLRRLQRKQPPQLRSVRKVLRRKACEKPCTLTPHLSTSRHLFAKH